MDQTVLEQMQFVDRTTLTDIVRQDQRCQDFEILDWSVRPLSQKGMMNPEGLFLFEGRGRIKQAERTWQVVVKNFQVDPRPFAPDNIWYWKREVELFQSDLLLQLPGPVRAPRCYRIEETGQGGQIWMEFVTDQSPERWTLDQFIFAAHEIGRWNGRCLQNQFLPQQSWLSQNFLTGWLEMGNQVSGWRDYSDPLVQKTISRQTLARAICLIDDQEYWFDILRRLPQVFSHQDTQRRNLMIRESVGGQSELVLIDWALVGIGPLGMDLQSLIGASAFLFEVDMSQLAELEKGAFDAYLSGLREEGWEDNPEIVRLAYAVSMGLRFGATGPALNAGWSKEDRRKRTWPLFHCGVEDVVIGQTQLCEFALALSDEARELVDRLKL